MLSTNNTAFLLLLLFIFLYHFFIIQTSRFTHYIFDENQLDAAQ